jgi:hypothetical protein
MSDSARPNEDALVISRVTPLVVTVQRYSAWVWPEMITLIEGSSRDAMSRIGLPARLPAQPFSVAGDVWKPPWWITSTGIVTPRRCSARTAAFAASASSVKVSPATPDGVTIVGVSSSTSPMNPTRICPAVTLEDLDPAGREQRATVLAQHVRGQVPEVRAG